MPSLWETSYFNGFLHQADRYTNLPRFQGARPDHVQVQSSRCYFPRASLSFVRPWASLSLNQWHVTRSLPIRKRIWVGRYNNTFYYMASSASGQDEPNRAMWLATRAGKMEQSCPLGTTRSIPQEKSPRKSHIINPLLTKFVRSRWLDIGLVLFLRVYGSRLRLGP